MALKSTQLRESQSLVINYAMAPHGSNEVKPCAFLTPEAIHLAQFTQGVSAVHISALSAVDPTPPPTGRPAGNWSKTHTEPFQLTRCRH